MRLRWVGMVLLLLDFGVVAADERPEPAALRKLVEQLGSDDFDVREKATLELSKLDAVPGLLKEALTSDDLEIRRRARAAVEAITARVEERRFQALVAELQKVEVDRLVSRLVSDQGFAAGRQWDQLQALVRIVVARAEEQTGRKFALPVAELKALPLQVMAPPPVCRGKQLLLADPEKRLRTVNGCVILSAGPMPSVNVLRNSIIIIDGDFPGPARIDGCLVIVRGNVGRLTTVEGSIILATGTFGRATSAVDSLFQVGSEKLTFGRSENNVYVGSVPANAAGDVNGRVVARERGPLRLLKFSEPKKEPPG